jgi:hypothetical protein
MSTGTPVNCACANPMLATITPNTGQATTGRRASSTLPARNPGIPAQACPKIRMGR